MRDVLDYQSFLAGKLNYKYDCGFIASNIHQLLFDFQKDIVTWSCKKGRSAIFADCGLGKSLMQISWADNVVKETLKPVIIIAPLSVNYQTMREGEKIAVKIARFDNNSGCLIEIANYENLDKIDANKYSGIVIDESSILKSVDSKTRKRLIEFAKNIPYRLACTATPAPNDISEIANHTEFLGIMKREEMLAKWFYNDGKEWKLKGHAFEAFYEWMATWAVFLNKPSDLGYSDDGFVLPELNIKPLYFDYEFKTGDGLFDIGLKGIEDRVKIRKETVHVKAQTIADKVNESDEQFIIWCGIDLEADTFKKLIPDSVNVQGKNTPEEKEKSFIDFIEGKVRVLISKPKIAGFGMNFQHAHNMIFMGLSDSYEAYYQCIRREYRFGQKNQVNVLVALAGNESIIFDNVLRKERDAKTMSKEVIKNINLYEQEEIKGTHHEKMTYNERMEVIGNAIIYNADSCVKMPSIPSNSMDLSIFSPPFASLFTYSNSERDLGNCQTREEFMNHMDFISKELYRIMKPGRNVCVHCMNLPTRIISHGYIGLEDFRGDLIRHYQKAGFIYYGEVCIWKNPQVQSIRTHTKMLAFHQFNKDSLQSVPALPDYILVFKKHGDPEVPVVPTDNGLDNEKWIEYASPIWMDIRATYTLNSIKSDKDEKHMCPLQLDVIERLVRLYSNKGETVFSPFTGVGSEGHVSLLHDRKFTGIELKPEYFDQAIKNINDAIWEVRQRDNDLFSLVAGMEIAHGSN